MEAHASERREAEDRARFLVSSPVVSAYLEPARNVERRLEVDRRVENDQRVVAELHLRYRCIAAVVRTVYVAL